MTMVGFQSRICICVFFCTVPIAIAYLECPQQGRIYCRIGGNATFTFNYSLYGLFLGQFYQATTRILRVYFGPFYIRYYADSYKNRTEVIGYPDMDRPLSLKIILMDIRESDSGSYTLKLFDAPSICWMLFVVKEPTIPVVTVFPNNSPGGWSEAGSLISFTGTKSLSNSLPPGLQITMTWLLDGEPISTDGQFVVDNHTLRIPYTIQTMTGTIITYRAAEESGSTSKWNYTIKIYDGPGESLTLEPDRTFYLVQLGDQLPDVNCSAECHPPCDIIWRKMGNNSVQNGNLLHLGTTTGSTAGEYSCQAVGQNPTRTIKRSIYVQVQTKTNPPAMAAMSTAEMVLTALLVITILGLIILAVYTFRKFCCHCRKDKSRQSKPVTTKDQGHSNDIALENYTDLCPESRTDGSLYGVVEREVERSGTPTDDMFYENTELGITAESNE